MQVKGAVIRVSITWLATIYTTYNAAHTKTVDVIMTNSYTKHI